MELARIDTILEGREGRSEQLIEVLQDMQAEYQYLPEEGLRRVSETLGVKPIEVYRVASFYKTFSLTPRGRHLMTACLGTACHVRGASRFLDTVAGELEISPGETTSDGALTLEKVNCLGCCALGPVVVLDGEYHGKMTTSKLRKLIAAVRKQDEGEGTGDA